MSEQRYLNTGSTLLNLAISGRANGGWLLGTVCSLVGDSGTGKTFASLTCMAEACRLKSFDDYQLIFDDGENGAHMDFAKFFGTKAANRIQPPFFAENRDWGASDTIDEMFYHLRDAMKKSPVIYVRDSMDALTTPAEQAQLDERIEAIQDGKAPKGSYGDGKARLFSQHFRTVMDEMKRTGSLFLGISQTRDNIGHDAMFNPKTRSGGRALGFYESLSVWLSKRGKIQKTVDGNKYTIAIKTEAGVKKNRSTGADHAVPVLIFRDYGIDDIASSLQWACEVGLAEAGKTSMSIELNGQQLKAKRLDLLAKQIDENNLTHALRVTIQEKWDAIEDKLKLGRPSRYE